MQLLFALLFGGIVCFILYLSYDSYKSEKNKNTEDELEIDLNKYSDLIETEKVSNEEIIEKVDVREKEKEVNDTEVVVKFKARRNKSKDIEEEEII